MEEIDFIIPWVDGSDEKWIAERNKYAHKKEDEKEVAARYRDWDNLHYWFRGVEQFAPWVRKIHFITWGHLPKFLNTTHPKINIVKHEDYIPRDYLPVFGANPIELNLHRIKSLSEKFVYFNDDMFLIKPTPSTLFFDKDKPRDQASLDYIGAVGENSFAHILLNDIAILNKHFNKKATIKANKSKWINKEYDLKENIKTLSLHWANVFPSINLQHLPQPFLKSTLETVWEKEFELLSKISQNKFRSLEDVNQYLFRYWQLATGEFTPINRNKLGKNFSLKDTDNAIFGAITNQKYHMICANDSNQLTQFARVSQELKVALETILPEKSSFER